MLKDIAFKHVCFGFRETGFFLKDISFEIKSGEVLGLFGASSSGKTTLLNLLCGIYRPESGTILINGRDAHRENLWKEVRRDLAVSFQFPEDMFYQNTVLDEFQRLFNMKTPSNLKEEIESHAKVFLKWAGLDKRDILSMDPLCLSHGEQRRLCLALILAQNRDCVIMDEPVLGIEPISQKRLLYDLIKRRHKDNKIGIILSHDTGLLLPLVDRIIILNSGEIIAQGLWDEILKEYGHLPSVGLSLPQIAESAIKLKENKFPLTRIWKNLNQALNDIDKILS